MMFIKKVVIPDNFDALALATAQAANFKPINGGFLFEFLVMNYLNILQVDCAEHCKKQNSGHDVQVNKTVTFTGGTDFYGNGDYTLTINAQQHIECKNNSINYANFGDKTIASITDGKQAVKAYLKELYNNNAACIAIRTKKDYFYIMDFEAAYIYISNCYKVIDRSSEHKTRATYKVYKIDRSTKFVKNTKDKNYIIK